MWRVVTSTFIALTFISSVAAAQQPCTTDAARVVAEVYRHTLERGVDAGAQRWQQALANGQMNVREVVRAVAKSPEYQQRFWRTEPGEGQPFERSVARLYRHVLGRQPDEGGMRTWANVAQQQGLGATVDGLVNSSEYDNSFGDWAVPGSGGIRFCANGSGSTDQISDTRFRGMDRNGDGVISRSEWRGGEIAFDNQDRNNDGVLSGNEVSAQGRSAGRRAADYDFDRLDVNGNNRIERREWQARLDQFNELDVNNDRFLSREELEGRAVGTAGSFIAVGGDRQWVDTGLDLRAGETVTVNADGQIRLSRNTRDFASAAGMNRRIAGATIPSAPAGSLLARVGNTSPIFVGDNRTFRAPRAGRLYLGVNDDYFDDNTGQYNVTIDVQ